MNISLQEKALMNKIDKLINSIEILKKKEQLWGLGAEDTKKLLSLTIEYLRNYYQLIDIAFGEYIEPFIFNDKIIDLKEQLRSKYNWEGNILLFNDDISELMESIGDDKKSVLSIIEEITKEEIESVKEFKKTDYGQESIKMFCTLQNKDLDEDCMEKYINTRLFILKDLFEEIDEEEDFLWED